MPKKKISDSSPDSFEKTMKSLENLVERLESDELPLEKALEAFESGIKLARQAQAALAEAEQKVYQLSEEGAVIPLHENDSEEEEE